MVCSVSALQAATATANILLVPNMVNPETSLTDVRRPAALREVAVMQQDMPHYSQLD